jgi:lipoprotein signal peptidase
MAERSYRKLFWGLAAAGFVLDQATKYGVFRWLYNGGQGSDYSLVPGAFDLLTRYTDQAGSGALRTWGGELLPEVNHGALGGFLNQHVGLANTLFAVISLAAAVAIAWWSSRPSARRERGLSAALGLILAGTLGNLFDRLVFGGVRDFLHLHYQSFDWPVFNVADSCLVLGAFLLLAQAFFGKSSAEAPAPAPAAAPQEMAEAR